MEKRIYPQPIESVSTPEPYGRQSYSDASEAVEALKALYERNTSFLRASFDELAQGVDQQRRFRAYYAPK